MCCRQRVGVNERKKNQGQENRSVEVNAASIQPRLRVLILPVDSKVESSNMACLPDRFSRAGWEAVLLPRAGGPLGAPAYGGAGAEMLNSVHPNPNHCASVDTAGRRNVPELRTELRRLVDASTG